MYFKSLYLDNFRETNEGDTTVSLSKYSHLAFLKNHEKN